MFANLVSIRQRSTRAKAVRSEQHPRLLALSVLSALLFAQACADGGEDELDLEATNQELTLAEGGSGDATFPGSGDATVPPPDGSFGDASFPGMDSGFPGGGEGGFIGGEGGFIGGEGGFTGGLDGGIIVPEGGIIAGGGFAGDGGFPAGTGGPVPFANWKFDDCGPSTTLLDSSPSQAHAQRSAQVSCAQGLSGGALLFDAKKDTVTAAARPAFDVSDRVAVAAWIRPTNVSQSGTVVVKQLNGSSAFELVLNNGNLIFRINIDNGRKVKQIVSKAPIQANRWTHVAALYDGSFVRLFEDGVQVGQIAASGRIADIAGAIEIGNNQANEFLRGMIDEVWLSRAAVTASDIADIACIEAMPTMVATPSRSGPQDPGTTFSFDLAITNHDVGACAPRNAFANAFSEVEGLSIQTVPQSLNVAAGTTAHTAVQVTSTFDVEAGTYPISVNAFLTGPNFPSLSTTVEYVLNEPTGCFVRTTRELMIRDLSVVEDPLRTTFDGPADDPRTGAWTFGRLMEQLAANDADAPDMVEQVFRTWLSEQTVNTFTLPAKLSMQSLVLNGWPRTANGKLDLKRAPLRLLAIVNRIDSRNLAQGHAGEGRFVFGVIGPGDVPLEFTFIFEFRLPARTSQDVLDWANRWHALGALPFPSEQYNTALQAITDRFSRRGAEPGRVNDSALAQLRSNEIELTQERWELREFELSASTHRLAPTTVKLTPDTSFISNSPLVADFVNQNEASILLEQHTVPEQFNGQRFLGGSSFNDLIAWIAPGIRNNEARHKFSLNTCNGCHSLDENGTFFLHVEPRLTGEVARLSGFLQGINVPDIVTGAPRQFNDLARRNRDLTQLVCPVAAPAASARTASATSSASSREAFIAKGIQRTH